jgi:ribose transport system substrate-binding protein
MRGHLRLIGVGTIAIALMAAGCQGSSPTAGGSSSAGERVSIAFIAGQIGITFYTGMECGAKQAATEFNVDLNWTGSHNWDINEQKPIFDAAMAREPDGWVIAPTSSTAMVQPIKELMDAGTPVATVDAPLDKPVELQNLQSNHYEGGQEAAEAMLSLTDGEGSYLVLHLEPGLPDIGGRADGFRDAMEEAGAKVLEYQYPGTDTAKATEQVNAAIQAHPDLAGVYATHESAALGASAAIEAAGKQGEIRLVAFDAAPSQIADLKNGVYDALIAQKPFNMGYYSVKLVSDVLRGNVDPSTVEHDNPQGLAVITRDNADDPDIQALIYPADLSACPTKPV